MRHDIDGNVSDGDGDDKGRKNKRSGARRRLRGVFFLSVGAALAVIWAYAVSPRSVASSAVMPSPTAETSVSGSDGNTRVCELYLEEEFRKALGGGATDTMTVNRSGGIESCRETVTNDRFFLKSEPDGFETELRSLVSGYPIETMVPAIAEYDRSITGLLVGIAKKESDWGRYVPSDVDGDCFNYWGYKGAGSRGTAMGYGCFGTPEEAVRAVGDRIVELASLRQATAPEKLVVWKCGSSCAGHSPESVRKWIADVRVYYDRVVGG